MRSLCLVLLASALSLHGQTSVLFLGNSYTSANDLPYTFQQLALSLGDTVTTGMVAPGGFQLGNHADHPASLAAIASQPWDFVVMQEQSQLGALPFDMSGMELGATMLTQLIEANDECTFPVFYMTWGRENGDADLCPDFPNMCTYASMQQSLRDNYVAIGVANDGYVAPVGMAWKELRGTHPLIDLYAPDGSHPSAEGTYLAACVFYCTLFQQSCVGATFNASIAPDTATVLRAIASATVLDSTGIWNLEVANGTDATISGSSSDAPYSVTFYHPGEGLHWWVCSDGQSSTDANPTFLLAGPGTYTFSHTYVDPCGNLDAVTWTTEVYAIGMAESAASEHYQVWSSAPSEVEVSGGRGNEVLTIFDLQGRVVSAHRSGPAPTHVSCPAGLYGWMVDDEHGAIARGKVLIR